MPVDTPSEYRNNLEKDDPVIDAETKRPGKVAADVRHNSRSVLVLFQGERGPKRVDVTGLRLVVDGVAEETAPIDGTPPERLSGPREVTVGGSAIDNLRLEGAALDQEMRDTEVRFKDMRTRRDRIDQAIAILAPPPVVPRTGTG